jgi:S1-C subfamily serine protease
VRPGLGINMADDSILRRAGIPGVLIRDVAAGSAADKAGLLPTRRDRYGRILLGDIIVAVDGKEVGDSDDLYRALDQKAVGQTAKVTVLRDGKKRELTVRLQAI